MRRAGSLGKVGIQSKGSAKEGTLKKNKAKAFNKEYTFMNVPNSGISDNTGGTGNPPLSGFPSSTLSDYIFTAECSGPTNILSSGYTDKSKIHVTNVSDVNNIVHFSWTPSSSDVPDFYNANEMLIWGNDIYVVYKWSNIYHGYYSPGSFEFQGKEWTGYENVYDSNGEHLFYPGYKYGHNKIVKFVNCTIDESAEEINYDSFELLDLPFVGALHGNTVSDDFWILQERAAARTGAPSVIVKVPLSGSMSNFERLNYDKNTYDPTLPKASDLDLAATHGVRHIPLNSRFQSRDTTYKAVPAMAYCDQITCSDKFVYTLGSFFSESGKIGRPPFYDHIFGESYDYSRNGLSDKYNVQCAAVVRCSIDGGSVEVVHPIVLNGVGTLGKIHVTSFGDYVITTYRASDAASDMWVYKYNRKNPALDIAYYTTWENDTDNDLNFSDVFSSANYGEATFTHYNIYQDLVDAGHSVSTAQGQDYVKIVGTQHMCYADGEYIWTASQANNTIIRYDFETLEIDEISTASMAGATDDFVVIGDNLWFAGEGSTKNLYYINKEDFSAGPTVVTAATFTHNPYGVFHSNFIY